MDTSMAGLTAREGGNSRTRVLSYAIICVLALSAYFPLGSAMWFVRAAAAILAGRALVASVSHTETTRWRRTAGAVAYILAVWIATFSPIPLLGSPDVVRSSAASATLVLIVSGLSGRTTLALSAAMALSAIPAGSLPPHPGALGALEFVLGATWPRDWSDVTVTAGLFLLGGGWAATSVRGGTRPIAI